MFYQLLLSEGTKCTRWVPFQHLIRGWVIGRRVLHVKDGDTFEPFTETDIRQLLTRSSNAFRAVDPMPTWLVKDCLDILINPIINIVNKSLSLYVFPRSTKAALVKPLIKNHTMDCTILNNYRHVSNLTFYLKL